MKICPRCAEQVQTEAKVCRYCGHQFKTKHDLVGRLVGIGLTVFVAVWAINELSTAAGLEADAPYPAAYDAQTISRCNDLINDARRTDFIKSMPTSTRVNVEDSQWTAFPADSKKGLMQALACQAYGRPLRPTEYVVAYGYRSGKRVAMATSVGVNLE